MPTMSPNKDVQKNAQDWVRDLRFSNQVNMQTMGVDTDRVTPQLLLASSNKLLGISRGEQQGDPKDSLQFQRVYGPVEYFAERIQKDGGSVARQMLWKATNKGNLDFIGAGSLQPHVNAVFHESNLSQFVDNSTPFESVDTSQKVTRVGEGGISDGDSAPIEMRLVQPSYYGYVGGIRTAQRDPGITAYLTKNVMKGTDGKLYQTFINMHTGNPQVVDSQTAAKSVVTTNEYLDSSDSYVYAIGGPKGVRIVKRSDVDYILPNPDDAFSAAANTVPMFSGDKAMRLLMGCHHPETPMAVVDSQGYTHIVPAKRLSQMGDIYVLGCDKKGNDQLYPVRKIITRVPERKSKFKKVILSSGRVLITSMQHKWWIYQNGFNLVEAKDLQKGMIVPRSLFTSMPVRPTKVMGVPVTREICVFLGRVIRSLRPTSYSYRVDFVVDPDREVDQEKDILTAIKQLGIKNCNMFHSRGIHAVTIKDPVFQDWVDQNVGKLPEDRRIPSEILSLPQGYTSIFLDSYYKDLQTLGEDNQGDTWLISIANPSLRDSLSFMLNKIYTDTKYRDCTKKKTIHRALQLFPAKTSMGDIVLQKITKVLDVSAPAVMIDIDCDDNVYATANGIITHNSKYVSQAVPLQEREAPLVRGLDAQTGMDMPTKIGKLLGTQWAPKPGMVKAVREDRIDMLYDDGTTGSVPLYKNFPANAKGWLTNYPKVKAGDKVAEGQLLATSNYTDDNGVLAMGRNLRIGYMSYHGGTYEDACTLSQSAAKKMGYTTMYKTSMDKEKSIRTAKNLYKTWKPGQYTKEQLDNIGDDGVVKVGAVVNKGDPVILGIRTTEPSPGTLGKRILTDVTQVWEHANPGTVTDVVNGKNGIKVFATVSSPLREGDKVTQEHGGKGTVAQILPDDKMPRDSKGRPLDILFDPLGIVSRCYDEQTQFLTEEGWKFGKNVKDSDKLLSWDLKAESFSYLSQQQPFYKKEYKGAMYKASNEVVQLQVTPKHRVAYKWPGQDTVRQGFIEDIYGKSCYLPKRDLLYNSQKQTKWQFISCIDWSQVDYEGTVYCPTVSTGYVLTRRNGKGVVAHNTNPSQLMQAGLGKVAQKIGQPIVVPQFMPKGQSRLKFVKDLMKQHNVPWKEDVYDPDTGRTIKNVYTGVMYFLPLKHIADTKMSARGTAKYSAQGVPLGGGEEGSKRIGNLQTASLVGHGVFDFLHDAKLIRGQQNSDFWRQVRSGQIPTVPGQPLAHKKFFAHLQASGMQIKRDNEGVTIFALSNKDVDELAGTRELKSTDTYQQKSFRPIDGGLFGTDIFGPDGDKWAYIQLDSPLPNPVMQEPLARLLNIPDREFQAIVRGKGSKEGLHNASDMKKVLSKMDLKREADRALAELKTSTKSKKDNALKRYVAIARMRDAGVRPQEYMLDRIPVLPPKFRPITSHGGLTMVADSNYLYSQLLNARDDLREAEGLPEEYKEQGLSNLYSKWKELVGLYDPSDVKLKSKNVKGLLKWALGTSPKWSAYHQKVLGSTVDTVGRGVIIPSTKIKLNQVGMPVQMAWNLYSPFVTRKLVQQGYSPVDALKLIKERKPVAMQALAEAVKERPCVINRAPSLHKLSLIGLNTKLTNGHAIKINPSIVSTLAADFDGNCCDFDSEIIVKVSKSGLDKLEKGCRLYQTLTKESSMITTETRIEIRKEENNEASYGCIKIGEFPRFGTPVKDKNGADVYKVPGGYQVEACDPVTGERGFYDIEALTVEDDCDTVKVEAGNHSVIVSSNESLAVFDTASGKLTKVAPKDLNGRLVPILKKDVAPFGNSGNRDVGWLIGSLISDGWVTSNVVGYAKLEEVKREEIERIFRDIDPNFLLKEYTEQPEEGKNKLGESAKIHIYSPNLAEFVRQLNILDEEGDMSKKTACRKQINRNLIRLGSEEFLWGILSGLIDGDGSIIMNTTMKNPRFGVRYSTSSPSLRDTFCALLYRLGIRYSITTTPPRNWSNEAYTICPSTIDMYENIDKLTCIGSREREMIQKWKDAAPVYEDKKDQVPVSDEEWEAWKAVCNNKSDHNIYSSCMKRKENRSVMRASILKYSTYLKLAAPSLLKRAEEKNTLWYPAEVTEDTGKRQVFDLMVKDAKVFAVNNGFVIWDTVNLHVPVSQKAVQDVRTKMMPEQNLISLRKGKAQYIPQKLYTQGLYVATRMGQAKDIKVFPGISEARKEYLKGNIDIDTPIVIKEK